jgi:D-glycero-alpha-D-manno-heptose-7-phosphate kinase
VIITRTPFRISFFGGGTDYPAWYQKHGGVVLSSTIDQYCYISCRYLPPFFPHKHRIVYSLIETVREISEIKHPAVKAVLQWAEIAEGMEIHYNGDLPARSGLGSSSAFTVGLIHALCALQDRPVSKDDLAHTAIYVEQKMIPEYVGSQDQISAAFGGFNRIEFHRNDTFDITPILLPEIRMKELQDHLMLFFTGVSRIASEIAKSKIENLLHREKELTLIKATVDEAIGILQDPKVSIDEFGRLLHQGWIYKRRLSERVTNPELDHIYSEALRAGAIGGKILGAGGGGFFLLFVKPERQPQVRERLHPLIHVPVRFDHSGSQVIVDRLTRSYRKNMP